MAKPRQGNCKSCGARIIWAENAETGKPIPLNATRVRTYHMDSNGMATPMRQHDSSEVFLSHISHFVTCPNASSHSKRKPDAEGE